MMFDLPKKCYVNKFLPKKIFYEKIGMSSSIKDDFTNLIERIIWLYKISPDTVGILKTENVEEIEIFKLELKEKKIPLGVIKTITKGIPYKILFILKYKDDVCYCIRVDNIYNTEWNQKLEFNFSALNLETMYEKIVKCILNDEDNNKSFDEIVDKENRKMVLEKKIDSLKNKVKIEKQFNRKVELNGELNQMLFELEEMKYE